MTQLGKFKGNFNTLQIKKTMVYKRCKLLCVNIMFVSNMY